MRNRREMLDWARNRLHGSGIPFPLREASLLLRTLLGLEEAELLAHDLDGVPPEAETSYRELVERRAAGAPVAYLTGEREFWGRRFRVDRRVLIPRPETEHLVEIALGLPLAATPLVFDVGTGSGCLAVTLACERPAWRLVGTDRSPAALVVAGTNASRHGVSARVARVASDLLASLDTRSVDLVLANLPYIAPEDAPELSVEVRDHEPSAALFAPNRGLGLIERLLAEGGTRLRPGTWLVCELGAGQAAAALSTAERLGRWSPGEVRRDLAGVQRDIVWRRI
jgi:release factor glutamine methyltransferase